MVRKQIKLLDIATELNVSVGLVSLVLSGKGKENRISDAITQKVLAKASEMGYKTNQLARGLRTGRSGIIGIIVADIANPYFGKMARSIENEASKLGYHVMFGSSDENAEKLNSLINMFLSRQVDAMAIVPVEDSLNYLLELKKDPTPVVYIDRYCNGIEEDVCCADNFSGGYMITKHLVQKGYKKIGAFATDNNLSTNTERIRGYREGIKKNTEGSDNELVYIISDEELGTKLKPALKNAIDSGCDALFFANNSIAIKSIKLFDEMGVSIPADIGIASFDNPEAFEVSKPGITCYEQPIELICSKAVQTIYEKLEMNGDHVFSRKMFEGKLILRDSC